MKLFLAGDVMTGRGVDALLSGADARPARDGAGSTAGDSQGAGQALPQEPARHVNPANIWGDAIAEKAQWAPDVTLVNLETAVTTGGEAQPKAYTFRMQPANVSCLRALGVDFCALANNHTMDWGAGGLLETRRALHNSGIAFAGGGETLQEARRPAVLPRRNGGRLLVFSAATFSAGSPMSWRAGEDTPGLWVLPASPEDWGPEVGAAVREYRQNGDVVVLSVHWGGNWGYYVDAAFRGLAHGLIDQGLADLVHGHSSHHVKPIEVYRGRLILYGCGDLMNDYRREDRGRRWQHRLSAYRPDLVLGYCAEVGDDGALSSLTMVPFHLQDMRLHRATGADNLWPAETLTREGRQFGTAAEVMPGGRLALRW